MPLWHRCTGTVKFSWVILTDVSMAIKLSPPDLVKRCPRAANGTKYKDEKNVSQIQTSFFCIVNFKLYTYSLGCSTFRVSLCCGYGGCKGCSHITSAEIRGSWTPTAPLRQQWSAFGLRPLPQWSNPGTFQNKKLSKNQKKCINMHQNCVIHENNFIFWLCAK